MRDTPPMEEDDMLRSLVFTALLHILPDEFGKLEQCPRDLAGAIISEVCDMIVAEGWNNPNEAVRAYVKLVSSPDNMPGYLAHRAEGLLAEREATH